MGVTKLRRNLASAGQALRDDEFDTFLLTVKASNGLMIAGCKGKLPFGQHTYRSFGSMRDTEASDWVASFWRLPRTTRKREIVFASILKPKARRLVNSMRRLAQSLVLSQTTMVRTASTILKSGLINGRNVPLVASPWNRLNGLHHFHKRRTSGPTGPRLADRHTD